MPLSIVPIQPDGRWPDDQLDLRPSKDARKRRLAVLILGAGFSKAANPESPTWKQLVDDVAFRMGVNVNGVDSRADAITLSWLGSRRPSSAVASKFQQMVCDVLRAHAAPAGMDGEVLSSVAKFVTHTQCDVILDLNYDDAAETMLDAAGISYYRMVGAQIDVRPPLPEGMIVLWKIHGSIDHPVTIVLSPTEYQRKYEVNELGDELVRLGSEAHTVWSIGVGLHDDDVWTFLTQKARDLEILALYMGESPSAGLHAALQPWENVLGEGVAKITVLAASLSDQPAGTLRHCVTELNKLLKPSRRRRARGRSVNDDATEFDDRFDVARKLASVPAMRVIVDEFEERHEKLVHYLLTRSHDSGHRWLPFLTKGDVAIDKDLRRKVAKELLAILKSTCEFVDRFADDWPSRGLLVGAAAQSVVRYVFEWLEAFAVNYRLSHDCVKNVMVRRERPLLVGANPFDGDVRAAKTDVFNTMQLFVPKESRPLYYPLVDKSQQAPEGTPLLKENEWEAAVISMFHARRPRLEIPAAGAIDLDWTWPVFPWGFGRRGIAAFRADTGGTITKSWHLVEERLSGGRQICKGGSLRDRGETIYMIARRGWIKIGEYDDFVEPST